MNRFSFVFSVRLNPHLSYFVLIGASRLKRSNTLLLVSPLLAFTTDAVVGANQETLLLIWQEEEETAEGAAEAERESGAEDGSTGCVHRLH